MESLHQALLLEQQQQQQQPATPDMKWTTVHQLTPESLNFNILLLIQSVEVVAERMTELGRIRIAEIITGDATGSLVISAKNEQIETLAPGSTVVVRNGRIDMFDGYMRLRIDKFGTLKTYQESKEDGDFSPLPTEPLSIDLSLNISERKYQWVN